MSNNINDYNFVLPDHLISQEPYSDRPESKLLVVKDQDFINVQFKNLFDFLPKNTVFIFNDTKVVQARILFDNKEVFFLEKISKDSFVGICKPGKKFKLNKVHSFHSYEIEVIDVLIDGRRVFKIHNLDMSLEDFFEKFGNTPLPPYIVTNDPNKYRQNYQTVYSANSGSVAAPTAGLHFSEEMIKKIQDEYKYVNVTLHVSLGTFKPIDVEDLNDHKMHSENLIYDQDTLDQLNYYIDNDYFIVAVGTTSLRFLQSLYDANSKKFIAKGDSTDIFIKPGFENFCIDALITNFHLPKSSLFVLVSAFMGLERMQKAYQYAIEKEFKFYSFGDSSLLIKNSGKIIL